MFGNKEKTQKTQVMERNLIAKNTTFVGDVTSEGDFRIDGSLEGTLKTNGRVIIGAEGVIKGTIESKNADIEGKFSGKLMVHDILTIKASAQIAGDVIIGKLSVEPGAIFNATCSMKGTVKELNSNEETAKKAEQSA